MPTTTKVLVAVGLLLAGGLAGDLLLNGERSSADSDYDSAATVSRISYQADGGAAPQASNDRGGAAETILDLGGLTIRASCNDYGEGGVHLSVSAGTEFDDAVIAVSFGQKKGAIPTAYTFGLSDFERGFGEWDFLGTSPDNTAGTLNYSRPDGGQVSVQFVADEDTAQGDCVFGGTAIFTP